MSLNPKHSHNRDIAYNSHTTDNNCNIINNLKPFSFNYNITYSSTYISIASNLIMMSGEWSFFCMTVEVSLSPNKQINLILKKIK